MRSLYQPKDLDKRIAYHKGAATDCQKAGFPEFAKYNSEMVADLESRKPKPPRVRDEEEGTDER